MSAHMARHGGWDLTVEVTTGSTACPAPPPLSYALSAHMEFVKCPFTCQPPLLHCHLRVVGSGAESARVVRPSRSCWMFVTQHL